MKLWAWILLTAVIFFAVGYQVKAAQKPKVKTNS